MRQLFGLLVLVVLGGLVWLVSVESPEPARAALVPEIREIAESPSSEPATLSEVRPTQSAESGRSRVTAEVATESTPDAVAPERVSLRGSVVLIDAQGGRHTSESGSLRAVEFGETEGVHEVTIEAGQFAFEMTLGTHFRIEEVELDGVDCGLSEPADNLTATAEGQSISLELYERAQATLIVRDRKSGQELAGLELWNHANWSYFPSLEPSAPTDMLVDAGTAVSPIVLPARDGEQTWWVRAQGYAWAVAEFDHRFGGERVVLLDPEAILVVQVENRTPGAHCFVHLSSGALGERRLSRELRASGGSEVRIGGLQAGPVQVVAKRAGEQNEDDSGSLDVNLVAGETKHLSLSLPSVEIPKAGPAEVTVSGTLELPKGTTVTPSLLAWKWVGEGLAPKNPEVWGSFKRVDPEEDLWSWKLDDLVPGLWEVRAAPIGFTAQFRVGPSGATDVAFRVPRLAEILVRVRDRNSGKSVAGASVEWYSKFGDDDSYGNDSGRTDEAGVFAILTAASSLKLFVSSDNYMGESTTVSVDGTDREEAVELSPSSLVTLTLKEGTTVVRAPIMWWLDLASEQVGGEGYVRSRNFKGDASVTLGVTEPGLYLLKFGELDGYLPLEPLEVRFDVGETLIDVELTRE